METSIGAGWEGPRAKLAALVGIGAVGLDLALRGSWAYSLPRLALGFAVLLFFASLNKNAKRSAGWRLDAQPSWSFWPRATMLLAGLVLAASLLVCAGLCMFDALPRFESPFTTSGQFLGALWQTCLWAPVEEELLYRMALCAPLAALVGTRWTILLGGLTFAGLHLAYGNLGANHIFAGFVLTWAYLRSGTLLVPILLHSLGNLAVLYLQWALLVSS